MKTTLFLVFSLPFFLFAGELSGFVSNNKGEKLPGVTIYFPELSIGAITDPGGNYTIKNLPEQGHKVQVSYIGYKTLVTTINIKGRVEQNFSLLPSSIAISEIVVSSGKALSREETPFAIESVAPGQLFQSGNITMMDGISSLGGVNQITYGAGIGKPVIRGLSFSRILTVYQGARFENQQWGEDHGLGLNDPGIDRVEVVKGPASLIYGSGAVGGVINIIDEYHAPPGEVKADFLQNFHSNTLGTKTSLGVKGAKDNGVFWSIRPGLESHADYLDGNSRIVGNSRFNNRSLKVSTGLAREKASTKFTYVYFEQELGIIEEGEMHESLATGRNDRKMQLPYQHVADHLVAMQHSYNFRKATFKLNLSAHQNFRKEIEENLDEIDLGLELSTYNFDAKFLLPINSTTDATFGMQSFYQSNKNMPDVNEVLIPDSRLRDISAFGLIGIKKNRLSYQGGLRYDFRQTIASSGGLNGFVLPGNPESGEIKREFSGFSGSSGLTYRINEKINLKANAATGFRAPDLAELFSNGEHPGTSRFEMGQVGFSREQNLEFDLGTFFHNNELSLELSLFYNLINNYIFFNPTSEVSNGLTIWKFEQEDVLLKGGEAGLKYAPGFLNGVELNADYSLVHAEIRESGQAMPQIPANRLNNLLKIKIHKKKQLFLTLKSTHVSAQERVGQDEQPSPGYNLFGCGINSTINFKSVKLDLGLNANNVTNKVYFEHLAVTRPFAVPNIGRNFVLSLRARF